MRPIPQAASRQFQAFTLAQAFTDGWTMSAIKHALRAGYIVRLRNGIYVSAEVMQGGRFSDRHRHLAALAAAAWLAHTHGRISAHASAVLAGLPILSVPSQPCLTFAPGGPTRIAGVHVHCAPTVADDVVMAGAIARTSSARTALDVARECGVDEGVVIADAALRRRMTSPGGLQTSLEQCRGWPGARRAAEIVRLADGRAESPLESISRLRFLDAELPVPRLQARIIVDGSEIARSDFLWEEFGVIGEADGMDKYDLSQPLALRNEKLRQERLEQAGLIVVRWGWPDIATSQAFALLVARLRWAFAQSGRLARTGTWQVA